MKDTNTKQTILKAYIGFVKKNLRTPSRTEMFNLGITNDAVRRHYTSLTNLKNFVREQYPDVFSKVVDETLFTQKNFDKLKDDVAKFKRFVVTTAVTGCNVHKKFFKAIKSYCEKNDALLLVLPCTDPAAKAGWNLDPILINEQFVYKDIALNSNFFISSIKLSAKHINPLTGLSRIGQRNGSFIYASPKQFLEFVPVANQKLPHALMTTGAITESNYQTERYMSDRTAYIAENDHVLGALIVEVEDDDIFYFRQIQGEPSTGNFVDLGKYYKPSGTVSEMKPEAFVLGDYHAGEHDLTAKQAWKEVCEYTKVKNLVGHDVFNGKSISHHEKKQSVTMAIKTMNNKVSLSDELKVTAREIEDMLSWIPGKFIMAKSNHDEWLARYLQEGEYTKDPINLQSAAVLVSFMISGEDPLKAGLEVIGKLSQKDRLVWLQRDEDYHIAKIECGAHGDVGPNGSRGSLAGMETAYGNCVIGHSHTPAIFRGVYRVGTTSLLKLSYNKGSSSWFHTSCLVYSNGSRQLINSVGGSWKLK